ncbi:unnamed protein product [Spirodela intermedia]|uniref:Diphthine--ammonia ligase n=1 Tax=Spirodela intermedia TaxID=51605 RepID=A0A7I8JCK3_SPIIN|nr:unnamed protein product [Spirodela intermedia]CAA6667132.1 unnamed protein product [Spirodela intermedia]
MKVVALVSGGKDSCYAMMRCRDYGHEIVALANLMPLEDSIDELDSYMFQTVGHQIVISYAECMGLPLFRRRIKGSSRYQDLNYQVTSGDEVEDMFVLLNEVKHQIPSITARLRVESVCSRLGLVSLAYLWKQDQTSLLDEMIRKEIKAITIRIEASKHLGRDILELQAHLLNLKEMYGINVCGEGGEYETLTLDCPLFKNARIILDDFKVILHSEDSIASVGILHPVAFHLECKNGSLSFSGESGRNEVGLNKVCNVHEVKGDYFLWLDARLSIQRLIPLMLRKRECTCQVQRCTFSMASWFRILLKLQKVNIIEISRCLQDDLTSILGKLELELSKNDFGWAHVLYIHLYISDMNEFPLQMKCTLSFITEKKCHMGVPSRSTIQLPLAQVGRGNASVEILVTGDQSKRVLHVQSISCWAPSCIGPYSQATLHREILYMAGQLGLDPPTMTLCPGGPTAEMEQALENCEAVANCFNGSITSSAILLIIYCSARLTLSERHEIQLKVETFLKRRAFSLPHVGSADVLDPIFLYVLAPDLPKALVEVKPVLHIPEDREAMIQDSGLEASATGIPENWDFEHSSWHDSCCQKWIISGKICAVTISITKDLVLQICSGLDETPESSQLSIPKKCIERTSRFCFYLLSRTVLENQFSWGDLMSLRFYFSTALCINAEELELIFSQALSELTGASSKNSEMLEEPIFNLIPVLSSGGSASMDDLLTCELFASKT